jgi:hypothetical protein
MNGFVYAIADGHGHVKIGWAKHPDRRLAELNVATPGELALVGYLAGTKFHERRFHQFFKRLHVRGEWFWNEGIVANFVSRLLVPVPLFQRRRNKIKPRPTNALGKYLARNKITQQAFAASIGSTQRAVDYWLNGGRTPRPEMMQRIVDATNGAVTPNDFLAPVSEPQEAAE